MCTWENLEIMVTASRTSKLSRNPYTLLWAFLPFPADIDLQKDVDINAFWPPLQSVQPEPLYRVDQDWLYRWPGVPVLLQDVIPEVRALKNLLNLISFTEVTDAGIIAPLRSSTGFVLPTAISKDPEAAGSKPGRKQYFLLHHFKFSDHSDK